MENGDPRKGDGMACNQSPPELVDRLFSAKGLGTVPSLTICQSPVVQGTLKYVFGMKMHLPQGHRRDEEDLFF